MEESANRVSGAEMYEHLLHLVVGFRVIDRTRG